MNKESLTRTERLNYLPWQEEPLTPEQFERLEIEQQFRHLITTASLAASSHNTQPWAFHPDLPTKSITVFLDRGEYYTDSQTGQVVDRRRVLAASDIVGRQAGLSLGWAYAHLEISLNALGLAHNLNLAQVNLKDFKPLTQLDSTLSRFIPTGSITLTGSSEPSNRELYQAIFTRRMNRSEYDNTRQIPPETAQRLTQITSEYPGVHLQLVDNRAFIKAFALAQGRALQTVASWEKFMQELGLWLLPNDTVSYLGMPGNTMLLSDEMAKLAHQGLMGKDHLPPTVTNTLVRNETRGVESASLLGVIFVSQDDFQSWIHAGRAFGHIGLVCESQGLSQAVHAGLAEVPIARQTIKAFLGQAFSTSTLVCLFRVGYPKPNQDLPPHSPRLPIDQITLT